jgi:hypothetical protein
LKARLVDQQRFKQRLALDQRQGRKVPASELQEIESDRLNHLPR